MIDLLDEMASDAKAHGGPTDSQLRLIAGLANKQCRLEKKVARAEELFEGRKKQLLEVQRKLLPEALKESGLTMFGLVNGGKVEVKEEFHATISKNNAEAAMKWLRDNEHGGIIKSGISLTFAKGDESEKERAVNILAENGFAFTQGDTVNPQTLKAFVKDQDLDKDPQAKKLFGVYVDKVAKIKIK